MSYRKTVATALSSLDIPVAHLTYKGTKDTYCRFQRYNMQGGQYAEGKEVATNHYIQVDIFGPVDMTDYGDMAETSLVAAGLKRIGGQSTYEDDTKLYHDSRDYLFEERR